MKQRTFLSLAVVAAIGVGSIGALAQQNNGGWWGHGRMSSGQMGSDHMQGWGWGNMGPGQQMRMQRHWTYMNEGVPTAYRGARSTVRGTAQIIADGKALYSNNCARCHGAKGLGDGEVGRSLVPSPALLKRFVQMPMAGDEYLLWAIFEGGERFGTDMPAFEEVLSEDDVWKIIAYMRAGFP